MNKQILQAAILTVSMALASQANAFCIKPSAPSATTTVTAKTDNTFDYVVDASGGVTGWGCSGYALPAQDTPGFMSDFYLPYFSDMGIKDVTVSGYGGFASIAWTYDLETANDLFGIGGGVMHFATLERPAMLDLFGNSVEIGFNALYAGTKGPFQEALFDPATGVARTYSGDPLIPGSPMTLKALNPAGATVPEPASLALLALGALGLCLARRKKA